MLSEESCPPSRLSQDFETDSQTDVTSPVSVIAFAQKKILVSDAELTDKESCPDGTSSYKFEENVQSELSSFDEVSFELQLSRLFHSIVFWLAIAGSWFNWNFYKHRSILNECLQLQFSVFHQIIVEWGRETFFLFFSRRRFTPLSLEKTTKCLLPVDYLMRIGKISGL